MTTQEFVNKWLGVKCDFDKAYGYQCVDLFRQFVKEVLGYPQSPSVVGAADLWDSYLPDFYERIPNKEDNHPVMGDIVIFNKRMGGGFGHVAIVVEADVNSLTVFEQDGAVQTAPKLKTYNTYYNVIGWLRPKSTATQYRGFDLTNLESMKVCVDDHIKIVDGQLVSKEDYERANGRVLELTRSNTDLSSQLGEKTAEAQHYFEECRKRDTIISDLTASLQKVNETDNFAEAAATAQKQVTEVKREYTEALSRIEHELKLSETADDTTDRLNVVLEAVQSLYLEKVTAPKQQFLAKIDAKELFTALLEAIWPTKK